MSISDFLNDIRLIEQADPDALNQFAVSWQQISGAFAAQGDLVVRTINRVWQDSQGATASHLSSYQFQLGDGMTALSSSSAEVAAGLRDIAPRLTKIQQDLTTLLEGLALTVGAVAVPESAPALVAKLLKVAGGASLLSLVGLVNDYHTMMSTLATALTSAEAKFQTLDVLNNSQGIVPAAPRLTPN